MTRNIVVIADDACKDAVTFTADGLVWLVIMETKSRFVWSKLIVSDRPLASLVEKGVAVEEEDSVDSAKIQRNEEDVAVKKGADSSCATGDRIGDAVVIERKEKTVL